MSLPKSERPIFRCPCGWCAIAVPAATVPAGALDAYSRCRRCGRSSDTFTPALDADVPVGATLGPCVVPQHLAGADEK